MGRLERQVCSCRPTSVPCRSWWASELATTARPPVRLTRASGCVDRSGWSPAERRRDVVSWSLEIAAGVALGMLVPLAVGVHVGRGVAFLVCGAGWAFPDLANLFISVPGVVAGDPAAGLDHAPSPEPADWALWTSIGVIEVLMILTATVVIRLGWLRWVRVG